MTAHTPTDRSRPTSIPPGHVGKHDGTATPALVAASLLLAPRLAVGTLGIAVRLRVVSRGR